MESITNFANFTQLAAMLKLTLAAFLGAIIGIERGHVGKAAGMRTYALVSLGAAFFVTLAQHGMILFQGPANIRFDPGRIIGQIVVGVGFIGAGTIIYQKRVKGLTTAAGLWVSAAIGSAVGMGLYLIASFATLLVFIILMVVFRIETHWGQFFHKEMDWQTERRAKNLLEKRLKKYQKKQGIYEKPK